MSIHEELAAELRDAMRARDACRRDVIRQIETEVTRANQNEDFGSPRHSAMSRGSGGIGKKEDSARASTKSAGVPYGVSAQCRTQSYSLRSQPGRNVALARSLLMATWRTVEQTMSLR